MTVDLPNDGYTSGDMVLHVHDKVKWCETSNEVNWLGPDKDIADSISARLLHHP